ALGKTSARAASGFWNGPKLNCENCSGGNTLRAGDLNMSLTMQDIIAKVGKGEKASKDLTYQEATAAMRLLLEKHATSVQVGAFLLAMRIKSESVAELAALASAARGYVEPLPIPLALGVVDIPTYAGKPDG